MEGDAAAQKSDVTALEKERIKKSYDRQVERREGLVAREARFERKAQYLTKHFMKDFEQKEDQKIENLRQASQASYDKSMQKQHDGYASEQMLKEMVREEKNQISQLISMRTEQREREEQEQKDKEARRKYFREARIAYDNMQTTERHKLIAEHEAQRRQKIEERMVAHSARTKELLDLKGQEQEATTNKFEAHVAKVQDTRRKQDIEKRKGMHEQWASRTEKEKAAREARERDADQKRKELQEREVARKRLVEERMLIDEQNQIELAKRIANKGTSWSKPDQSPRREAHQAREPRETTSMTAMDGQKQEEGNDQKSDSPRNSPRKSRGERAHEISPLHSNKEMIDFNAQVQKDYFNRISEVGEARNKMHCNKKYKAMAEAVSSSEEDFRGARLKAVYQDFVTPKTKEPRQDKPISTRGTERPVARQPRTMTCGLCEREFPLDHLVGSALRQSVEKMRHLNPKLSMAPMSAREKPNSSRAFDDAGDGRASSAQGRTSRGDKKSLYDYEVKLCVNCDIFLRISSS